METAETHESGWLEPTEHDDKRGSPRRRVLKSAKIIYNDGCSVLDASLQDISDTGARIRLLTPAVLPDEFNLHLADGRKLRVETVWRNAATLGVQFIEKGCAAQPATRRAGATLLERISAIEEQLAELRRELTVVLRE